MEQQTNYIVFQCYGNEDIFRECAYALLSLSRLYGPGQPSDVQVWIYTDNPAWFSKFKDCPLQLHYRQVNEELIRQWKGAVNFVHRVKVELLKDFAQTHSGNILYLDCDIVVTHPLREVFANINNGLLYMHVAEGSLSDEPNKMLAKLYHHYKKNPLKINDRPVSEMTMWNAGVLGFNTQQKELLDQVLVFTDREFPQFPKHIIEQFAFSVFFQLQGPLKAAAPYTFHYWKLKEARPVLASFFSYFKDSNWDQLTRYSSLIQMHALMQEKVNFYTDRGIYEILRNIHWQPRVPDWQKLEQQL